MPRKVHPLTDLRIRKAASDDFPLWDGGGLHLILSPAGSRLWRLKYYRPDGRENRLGFGAYPDVSLSEARQRREQVKALLRSGKDPVEMATEAREAARRTRDAAFPVVARAWLDLRKREWAPETHRKAVYILDVYLVPKLKRCSITELTTKQASDALVDISEKAPALALKARQHLSGIVDYAIAQGLREDGRRLNLRGAVRRHAKGHIPAATDPRTVGMVVCKVRGYASPITRAALELAMLTAMRPGVVASARWDELDLDSAEWAVAADRMKTRHAHVVPLPRQAVELLANLRAAHSDGVYVFPAVARQKSPHLNRDALSKALRSLGLQGIHATHGFRGMLRTLARERLDVDVDVLEAQLAHAKRGDVQKAYDRTLFSQKRRDVMQAWADYLDELALGSSS